MTAAAPASQQKQQRRHLSIHEHEAMGLLQEFGIAVPKYQVAHKAEQAFDIAKEFGKKSGNFACIPFAALHWLSLGLAVGYSYN